MPRQLTPTYELAAPQALATLLQLKPTLAEAISHPQELHLYLQKAHHQLKEWFMQGVDTELLLQLNTELMDAVLTQLWRQQEWHDKDKITLLAVGGYGRKALHPHSDIDIAIVLSDKASENPKYLKKIQAFMASLWDSKLKVGHSVRSLSESLQQAEQDLATFTSLLESRLLAGNTEIAQQLSQSIYKLCSTQHFIQHKYQEYHTRYAKYSLPPYTLEPDIKNSPGGLRDIQLIEWLLNFIYKSPHPENYLSKLFIPEEQQEWLAAKRYLNTIRFARHTLSNQLSDQLIFDYQLSVGQIFSDEQNHNKLVSQFMREYFLHTRNVARLTHRGLQLLHAYAIPPSVTKLDHPYITLDNGEIIFSKERQEIITQEPWRLFEIFTIFAEQPGAYQLSVATQRLIEKYRHLIPDQCQTDPQYQTLFLRLIRTPKIAGVLELLHQYELLSKYIPEFSPITGMMQYDLFHAFPVDQHTLLLVQYLASFFYAPNIALFPLADGIAKKITKPEILFLAGLFHDIAKGRGGAHEELGAEFIQKFAKQHHFAPDEIELMSWLVKHHLLLSHTAQHQDISNPVTIEEFSQKVGNIDTLNYLYLLTIADIYATNTKLWTPWRSSLIDSLFNETMHVFCETHHEPVKVQEIIEQKQQQILVAIKDNNKRAAIRSLWLRFNSDYFLSYSATELLKHANFIVASSEAPVVIVTPHHSNSASEIFIYTEQSEQLFYAITSLLAQLQLSIVAAEIHTTTQHYNLSTYCVLQRGNKPLDNNTHIERVQQRIFEQLQHLDKIQAPELKHLPTRLQTFEFPTTIEFTHDASTNATTMSLFTADRPGLLATIAHVCYENQIAILRAQINTLAERAEDIFWLLNSQQQPLSEQEQQQLSRELQKVLVETKP